MGEVGLSLTVDEVFSSSSTGGTIPDARAVLTLPPGYQMGRRVSGRKRAMLRWALSGWQKAARRHACYR